MSILVLIGCGINQAIGYIKAVIERHQTQKRGLALCIQ
jgi:hypothetical protein